VAAFVYGSIAKGSDTARSDIDVLMVSDDAGFPEFFEALQPGESALDRSINPNALTSAEWKARREEEGSFAARIAGQPRLFAIGTEDDIP